MMWTMEYSDGLESVNDFRDPSCNGRKLRQLMPRPLTAHDHLLALNNYHLAMPEQNKKELIGTRQVIASSRWNPTPEQLHILEDLYRRGTRAPSADQIQQITAQLRRYGKIEGKNVFYWFQNHKARERQKRRRQSESTASEREVQQLYNNINGDESSESRDSAVANRTTHEVEQTKNWTTDSGTTAVQKTLSRQETTKAVVYKAADHGFIQYFDETNDAEILQQRKNATWDTMHFSCCSSDATNLIISRSSAATVPTNSTAIPPTVLSSSVEITTGLLRSQESIIYNNVSSESIDHHEAQTLQLFPVRSIHEKRVKENEEPGSAVLSTTSTVSVSNYQFYEFLPIKNC